MEQQETIFILVTIGTVMICAVGYAYRVAVRTINESKLRVAPLYKQPEYRLYEVGALIDGKVHDRDFVASVVDVILNPEKPRDDFEEFLLEKYANRTGLNRIKQELITSRKKGNENRSNVLKFNYETAVNSRLVKQGYFVYDPAKIRRIVIVITLTLLVIDYYLGPRPETISDWQIITFSLAFILAGMSYVFHQNYQKVYTARAVLLGYKMFLATTESEKVKREPEAYEDHLPMLIALGVHPTAWEEILDYTIDKVSRET